jgi:catechol 2,3-dioxygenase-like lactoylglutathione lyase family enzyme
MTTLDAIALSRETLDIGLFSDNPAMPEFYIRELGLPFVEALRHSPTYSENFYAATEASVKINYSTEPMDAGASGYRGLIIGRDGVDAPCEYVDPDGLSVTIVPRGHHGVVQMGIVCEVPDEVREREFLITGLGAREDHGVLRIGRTALFLRAAPVERPTPVWRRGFNYYVLFVKDIMRAHRHATEHGGEHSASPLLLGERCAFSWLRTPSGNWVEFVQYADYGPLPAAPLAADRWPEITRWRETGESF